MIETMKTSRRQVTSSSADLRKIKKPIIERKRRERINFCLNELKAIVLDANRKHRSCYAKMEKADILEMTVTHLRNISKQSQLDLNAYEQGFNHCVNQVLSFFKSSSLPSTQASMLMQMLRPLSTSSNEDVAPSHDTSPTTLRDSSLIHIPDAKYSMPRPHNFHNVKTPTGYPKAHVNLDTISSANVDTSFTRSIRHSFVDSMSGESYDGGLNCKLSDKHVHVSDPGTNAKKCLIKHNPCKKKESDLKAIDEGVKATKRKLSKDAEPSSTNPSPDHAIHRTYQRHLHLANKRFFTNNSHSGNGRLATNLNQPEPLCGTREISENLANRKSFVPSNFDVDLNNNNFSSVNSCETDFELESKLKTEVGAKIFSCWRPF